MWDRWCQAQAGPMRSLAPRPFIEPIREWFKKRRIGPGTHLARQAVCGGQWVQQRAFDEGRSDTNGCQRCAAQGVDAAGTVVHRMCQCPSTEAIRQELPTTWQQRIAHGRERLLWERGLTAAVPDPAAAVQSRTENWVVQPGADRSFADPTWQVAVDGSKVGRYIGSSRAGYAVVAADARGEVQVAVAGLVQADIPCQNTSGRGELEAVLALTRNMGAFPVTFLTDYQRVLDGFKKGRK